MSSTSTSHLTVRVGFKRAVSCCAGAVDGENLTTRTRFIRCGLCILGLEFEHAEVILSTQCTNLRGKRNGCILCQEVTERIKLQSDPAIRKQRIHELDNIRHHGGYHKVSYTSSKDVNVQRFVDKSYDTNRYEFLVVNLQSQQELDDMRNFLNRQINHPYACSNWTRFRWFLRWIDWVCCRFVCCRCPKKAIRANEVDKRKGWYCSELIAAAFQVVGYENIQADNPDKLRQELMELIQREKPLLKEVVVQSTKTGTSTSLLTPMRIKLPRVS